MSWKFTNWHTTHTKRRDKWDRIALIVVVAGLLLILGRYPLYIKLAAGAPVALLCGWLFRRLVVGGAKGAIIAAGAKSAYALAATESVPKFSSDATAANNDYNNAVGACHAKYGN